MTDGLVVASLALFGVLVAQSVVVWTCLRTTRVALEQSRGTHERWYREQRLEVMRWGAELALSPDDDRSLAGTALLRALLRAGLDPEDLPLLLAVLENVTETVDYAEDDDREGGDR